MQPFTVGELQRLLGERKGPCVSIFMPTHRRPDQQREDRLRFRNSLDAAARKLEAVVAPRAVARLLAPLEPCLDADFWRQGLDGFAAFTSADYTNHFRLALEMPERVVVSDTFHVRPLIRVLQADKRWYVIALSKKRVDFFEATTNGLVRKEVPGMPATLEEADVPLPEPPGLSAHTAGRDSIFFHRDDRPRSERDDLVRWFREVDNAVAPLLRDEHAPGVLTGVSRLQAVYRSITRLPQLAAEGVDGSFLRAAADEIHERTRPIALELYRATESEAVAEFQRKNGAMRSTDVLETVAEAAVVGRVRRLLIAQGRSVRGKFDRTTGEVKKRAAREDAYGDDVLDDVAASVLVRGGQVLVVDRDRMPTRSPVAAVLRW
jgi:hypothetical protein